MRMIAAAALMALVALATAHASAEDSTGSIYGRIYQEHTHRPMCNLWVRMLSTHEPSQIVRTREDGSYRFLAVLPGYVTVAAERAGSQRVEVHANLESDANFFVHGVRRGCGVRSTT